MALAITRPCSVAAAHAKPFTHSRIGPRPSQGVRQAPGVILPSAPSLQQADAACSTARPRIQPCQALDPRGGGPKTSAGFQFNAAYAAIIGTYAALFLLKNPYIFAALTVLTIIPQNSAITSLNSLVIIFYESGLFMNFAEAVYCVRLMTWLSIGCTLVSFAIFY